MNKNKKFIIFSIIATILAAMIIFLIIGYQNQKTQQQLQQEIVALKKEHDQLLTQIPKDVNWQSYVDEFYSAQVQKTFQQQKEKIKKEIADLKVNVTCDQSDLKAQKQCWLNFNQKINQTISNFHYFNDSYYDSYQKFNVSLVQIKNQIHDLLTQMSQLNTTEFNNKEYDLNFLSPEKQDEFQSNKSQIIATIEQLNNSQSEQITTCSQNKTLYQQLVCCQQKKQTINKALNNFNSFDHDYQSSYQIFNATFNATKKQFDHAVALITTNYDFGFLSFENQTALQNDQKQILSNMTKLIDFMCDQNKDLYQQLVCFQQQKQLINHLTTKFRNFDHDYQHLYQTFNNTFRETKKQFDVLLLKIAAFDNKEYNSDFFSPADQVVFQNNKSQVTSNVQKINHSTCSQNKTLYQQLMCYQEKNAIMNEAIKNFNSFDDDYHHNYQIFNATLNTAKKQFDALLANLTVINNFHHSDNDIDFLKPQKQIGFQNNKNQIINMKEHFNNATCSQNKMLYQQLMCYQEKNQEMNKTINYFNHFDNYYQQIKQKFIHDFQDAKEQLTYLLTTMAEIDITTFNNTPYDLGFLSSEKQNEFQKNKSKIISNVKKINNSTCSQNKMLYQQLKCYQEKNQTINDEIVAQQQTCAKKGSFYQLLCYQEKNQKINKIIVTQQQACAKKGSLYQQLSCYQKENQKINKTINYFNHFDDYYQQMKQEFDDDFQIVKKNFGDLLAAVTTLDQAEYLKFLSSEEQLMLKRIVDGTKQFNHAQEKECLQNKNLYQQLKCYQENINILIVGYNQIESKKQFLNLTAQISSLDVDELKTTEFTLNFFTFEQKVTFQDNKKIIINNLPPIQEKLPSITENLEFYQKFGMIYQQIVYCQQYIQTFTEQLAFCQNFKKQYFEAFKLSLSVENIKSGIKKIQTELEDIFMQNPNNVIENKIAIILEKIMEFEKKVKTYEKQPWSQFRAYHDFLAQQQEYFVETKHYVDNIIENIAVIKVTYTNNDIVSLISIINFNKEHVKLLTQMPKNVNWQSYVDDFYDEETQKEFQQKKDKLQQEIKDLNLKVNVVNCDDQSNLEAQKQCWLNFNQKMNQTINNFHYFNDSYYDSYQTFNDTFKVVKTQFDYLLVNISKLNTTEFNNTVYDLNFFSPEKQNEFQNDKNQIIATIQQFNNSQTEQIATCSQNKTLYQQLMCYQEKNVIINETIKNFNSFDDDYHHNYQIFNATFNATKKQFDNLLINMTTLKKSEYSEDSKLQKDRNQIIRMIRQFNTIKEIKCFHNKILYQQAKCYQENVAYLTTGFDQVKAEKKFLELKGQILTLNISELTNINVNFLSPKKQKELLKKQKNFIKVISQIQNELRNNTKFKPYDNNPQQLKQHDDSYHPSLLELQYYQKQNQQIGAQLKIFQTFKKQYFDSFESSLFTLIAKIKVGIKLANEKQQELTILQKAEQNAIITIAAARTQNITQKIQNITQKFQNVTQNVANFEKEIKQYANLPWSQFKAYHDFLVKYQNILQVSKEDIFEAKSIIEFIITGGTIFDEENI